MSMKKNAKKPETKQSVGAREKIVEECAQLNKTKSHFYPHEHGGEEEAHKACASRAAEKEVFWDEGFGSWYYYL
jgi:hypothetical protein